MPSIEDEMRERCRRAFQATFGESIRRALKQPLPSAPACLCAWYEHCEICSKPYPPSTDIRIEDYGRSVKIGGLWDA